MYKYDLREWVESLSGWLDNHQLNGTGRYCRYAIKDGRASGIDLDAYGCADAANILYTIGLFPQEPNDRKEYVNVLQSFQNPDTGIFFNETHSDYHTTAHCTAALELFDAKPLYPFRFMDQITSKIGIESFMDNLNWANNPWDSSHDGAGCAAALAIAGGVPDEWFSWYFEWLNRNADSRTGFWHRGYEYSTKTWPGLFGSLAGGFHYFFNYEHFRIPIPYPDKIIDTCLLLFSEDQGELGRHLRFAEIDWIFCLSRALRQSRHRRSEAIKKLWEMCDRIVHMLNDPKIRISLEYDNVHAVFGTLCAVAELQRALPGSIKTPRPLKLVLDRRPFI